MGGLASRGLSTHFLRLLATCSLRKRQNLGRKQLKATSIQPFVKEILNLCRIGGPIIFQHLRDSFQNQHFVLLVLQNVKSKISEKLDHNLRCCSSALLGLTATKFGQLAVLGYLS